MSIKTCLRIAVQAPPEPTREELQFIEQMGLKYVVTWIDPAKADAGYYRRVRETYAVRGIELYGLGNGSVHNVDAIVLGTDDRDKKVEEYKQHLQNLGEAGIPYTTYAHMANSVWSTPTEPTRGQAPARAFDTSRAEKTGTGGGKYTGRLTHGREYSEEEIWENFISFIEEIVPVAERSGVRIGMHPDDPPGVTLGGVPRPIFSSFEGYRKAVEIAGSPNVGLCLCAGCWLEGGERMGKDVLETVRYFGERKKIFKVHFRNVNRPLPHFVETFIDDGYMDMYRIMKALGEVGFDGVLIPDHIPVMAGDHRVGLAYTVGHMKALAQRAAEELG